MYPYGVAKREEFCIWVAWPESNMRSIESLFEDRGGSLYTTRARLSTSDLCDVHHIVTC